jgi:Chalcone isomerase-like
LIQALKRSAVMSVLLCASFFALAEPAPSLTTQVEGVTLPKVFQWNDLALPLSGAGLRTQFFFNVVVIALYGSIDSSDPSGSTRVNFPVVVDIHFLRDVDWDDITAELDYGLKANQTKEEMMILAPAIKQFDAVIKTAGEVKEGSTLSLLLRESDVEVRLNKKLLGTNSTPGLSTALIKIWLGDHPIQESVKKALLGKS